MADKTFTLQIISPTRIFFDEEVDMVEMRTTEGEIGVLAGHIPLTAIVEPFPSANWISSTSSEIIFPICGAPHKYATLPFSSVLSLI